MRSQPRAISGRKALSASGVCVDREMPSEAARLQRRRRLRFDCEQAPPTSGREGPQISHLCGEARNKGSGAYLVQVALPHATFRQSSREVADGVWKDRGAFLPEGLKGERIEFVGNTVLVYSRSMGGTAACPRCAEHSRHVRIRCERRLADLPAHDREVRLILCARRFRCRSALRQTRIFVERFPPAITQPHARRTGRLQHLVRHLGLALGGRPAQALASRHLLPVSKDTFLRSVRTLDGR